VALQQWGILGCFRYSRTRILTAFSCNAQDHCNIFYFAYKCSSWPWLLRISCQQSLLRVPCRTGKKSLRTPKVFFAEYHTLNGRKKSPNISTENDLFQKVMQLQTTLSMYCKLYYRHNSAHMLASPWLLFAWDYETDLGVPQHLQWRSAEKSLQMQATCSAL
jgi:hypothetical protein